MVIDLLSMIFTGVTAITAALALTFGFVYFNKRMKIYCFSENDKLKIIGFDKGNGACKIKKVIYSINNKTFEETAIANNECTINLNYYDHQKLIEMLVFDNFGRKYKLVYKMGK